MSDYTNDCFIEDDESDNDSTIIDDDDVMDINYNDEDDEFFDNSIVNQEEEVVKEDFENNSKETVEMDDCFLNDSVSNFSLNNEKEKKNVTTDNSYLFKDGIFSSHVSNFFLRNLSRNTIEMVYVKNDVLSKDKKCVKNMNGSTFLRMTKKLRQQYLTSIFLKLRNQIVSFNVKYLFRIYLVYHRDDKLIYSITSIFYKNIIYDASILYADMLRKNSKFFEHKRQRSTICNDVIYFNPNILRVFDKRSLVFYDEKLREVGECIHSLRRKIPTIFCFNETDIMEIFNRCKNSLNRKIDFPFDLLPKSIREDFKHLLLS